MAYQGNIGKILDKVSTPSYICEEDILINNLEILDSIKKRTGCRIILALKACSMFSIFPIIRKYLDGTTASSLNEACLGVDKFGKEVHVCIPAYREDEFEQISSYADHITFNSFAQWKKYKHRIKANTSSGIRINPELSVAEVPVYDPCGPFSRLGVTIKEFENECLDGISGIHFHTLCEQNTDALESTLDVVEQKFGKYLNQMEWLNFGGGHHITRSDYDIDKLCYLITMFKEKYDLEIILEPGEAVVLDAGVLVSSILDIVHNGMDIVILDTSAAAHMPDIIEAPYRPDIIGAGYPGQYRYLYKVTGNTCLAGDVMGDYSFNKKLQAGDRLVFTNMILYTMVKNNTFNGINLPSIGICDYNGNYNLVKNFSYEDFKNRLS
ncbi:MAG: carboxynorspermidine decarboxylase [bacterium]|nr:carboxynorspermidine decarboxylase [bacterium]